MSLLRLKWSRGSHARSCRIRAWPLPSPLAVLSSHSTIWNNGTLSKGAISHLFHACNSSLPETHPPCVHSLASPSSFLKPCNAHHPCTSSLIPRWGPPSPVRSHAPWDSSALCVYCVVCWFLHCMVNLRMGTVHFQHLPHTCFLYLVNTF